ncbi:MAG: type II secretion system F family protein [Alphaproteobacteria bacterium]|nr:type II secretion system F family protein [Alphaproteobacteria bacterium]
MNTLTLMPLTAAALVIIIYAFYYLYFSGNRKNNDNLNLSKKLNRGFDSSEDKEGPNRSLLKASPDNAYFTSKLPKIEGIKEWVQHAGLEINPLIVVTLSIIAGIIAGFVFFIVMHINILISCLLGIISAFLIPWVIIAFLTSRRKKQFLEEFPVALDIMRRALRAGHSIDRSIAMVVEQITGPVGIAFKQMVEKLNLGSSFDQVLAEMANRIGIDDFRMLAIVIVLQRETGGSLAEAIENFSKIIRSRQQLRKRIKALTAEVRVTSAILTAIPFVIFGAVYVTTPNYFDPLFTTENGQMLLLGGVAMLATGIGLIIRMTYKEIY